MKNKPNENQGRELLELHTVGRGAGYTEAMVKASAVLLSGYTVDWGNTYAATYDAAAHTTGQCEVLGFSHANAAADGQSVTVAYLKYLANHPATARRTRDQAGDVLRLRLPLGRPRRALADTYTSSGTDIRAVLPRCRAHPEFLTSEGHKVRTPVADLVATARVLDVDVRPRRATTPGPARQLRPRRRPALLVAASRRPAHDRPAVVLGLAACSPATSMHHNQAGGWWPQGATYRDRAPRGCPPPSPPLRRLRRPPVPHLARPRRRRPAAAGRDAGRDRPETWAVVTASTTITKHHALGRLAVPPAGHRPARHPRPHDHLRHPMTDHPPPRRTRCCRDFPSALAPLPAAGRRRPRRRRWPSPRCSATR